MNVLLADSGGTKTAWCYIGSNGERESFVTESYHPVHWSDAFFQHIDAFWARKASMKNARLVFFGAGCLRREKAEELEVQFKQLGFVDVTVLSDLHGAGFACYGKSNGTIAIMGTGSVMFDWKNQNVENVLGGKGHLEGDEGSGFYFGKLVLEAYRKGELTTEQKGVLDVHPFFNHILSLDIQSSKTAIATLSKKLSEYGNMFEAFHRLNIEQFLEYHVSGSTQRNISIVGGYAAAHSDIIREEFARVGIEIDQIIASPIERLIEQMTSFID